MSKTKREKIAEFFELPKEVIHGVLKITVYGDSQISVENYNGISEYQGELIRLKAKQKNVEIEGENLEIKAVTDIDVLVEGKITAVRLL